MRFLVFIGGCSVCTKCIVLRVVVIINFRRFYFYGVGQKLFKLFSIMWRPYACAAFISESIFLWLQFIGCCLSCYKLMSGCQSLRFLSADF